jgi:hypothetical protein
MDVQKCIPRNKHDLCAIERARALGFPELNEILPSLLVWLQDANWPIARPMASLLATAGQEIVPHIKGVFTGEDAVWKYWIIELLVPELTPTAISKLRTELERLADKPSQSDKSEGVNLVAQSVLVTIRF